MGVSALAFALVGAIVVLAMRPPAPAPLAPTPARSAPAPSTRGALGGLGGLAGSPTPVTQSYAPVGAAPGPRTPTTARAR